MAGCVVLPAYSYRTKYNYQRQNYTCQLVSKRLLLNFKIKYMKLNELRIGNYVTVDNKKYHPSLKDVVLTVDCIKNQVVDGEIKYYLGLEHLIKEENKYYDTYSQLFKFIKPIELTEKHLSDFEFVIDDENCWHKNGLTLDKRYTGDDTYEFEFSGSCINIIFVHQLQNLYFALTGKELSLSVC